MSPRGVQSRGQVLIEVQLTETQHVDVPPVASMTGRTLR
jgi:hypothetical protein